MSHYSIIQLPRKRPIEESKGPAWDKLVLKSKDIRLTSLKLAPAAFSAKLETESGYSDEIFEKRLLNPLAATFVAVSNLNPDSVTAVLEPGHDDTDLGRAVEWEWLGSVVLLGPLPAATFAPSAKAKILKSVETKESITMTAVSGTNLGLEGSPPGFHYQLNAMFVHPSARRRGVGGALIDGAVTHARAVATAQGAAYTHAWVIVDAENESAIRLYMTAGFEIVAEDTHMNGGKEAHVFYMKLCT